MRIGLVAPWHVGSSQTRAGTRVPCIGRRILNHCTTREVPKQYFFDLIFSSKLWVFQPSHLLSVLWSSWGLIWAQECPSGFAHLVLILSGPDLIKQFCCLCDNPVPESCGDTGALDHKELPMTSAFLWPCYTFILCSNR